VGECFFWYWLTRVVPDKVQSCKMVVVVVVRVHPCEILVLDVPVVRKYDMDAIGWDIFVD